MVDIGRMPTTSATKVLGILKFLRYFALVSRPPLPHTHLTFKTSFPISTELLEFSWCFYWINGTVLYNDMYQNVLLWSPVWKSFVIQSLDFHSSLKHQFPWFSINKLLPPFYDEECYASLTLHFSPICFQSSIRRWPVAFFTIS